MQSLQLLLQLVLLVQVLLHVDIQLQDLFLQIFLMARTR